jgi:hypothetical protein
MARVLRGIPSVSFFVSDSTVLMLSESLTVVGTRSCPRFGLPGLSGLDISIGWEGQSRGYSCGQAEDRRESHADCENVV